MFFQIVLGCFAIGIPTAMYFSSRSKKIPTKTKQPLKIAIIGMGGIGSTFALQLSQVGHDVTVIARNKRFEELNRAQAIITTKGVTAKVTVNNLLDPSVEYDLVLVTALAHHMKEIFPQVAKCKAKQVMFMFNTFEKLDLYRQVVGDSRFLFGFPAILAMIENEKLALEAIVHTGMVTTVTCPKWCQIFTEAGITATVTDDMESWLRTHVIVFIAGTGAVRIACAKNQGISWQEATEVTNVFEEGLQLVEKLGNKVIPFPLPFIRALPNAAKTLLFWGVSRVPTVRKIAVAQQEYLQVIERVEQISPIPLPLLNNLKKKTT